MAKSFNALMKKTMTKAERGRAEQLAQEITAGLVLAELRKLAGVSQSQLARKLGIKQPGLSKLEKQKDIQVSTLDRMIKAMGGNLEITANLPNARIRITQFQST